MINGIQTEAPVGFTIHTGLTNVKVVAVNPTTSEYKALTGRDRDMKYDLIGEDKLRPIKFIIHNDKIGYQDLDILLGSSEKIASTGSKKFMNEKGVVTWAQSEDAITSNPKMAWFGAPVNTLKVNEESIHVLLQALCQYNQRDDDAQWTTDLSNAGFNPDLLYAGNVDVLRQFITYYANNHITVALGVRSTEENDYQRVITNGSPFYPCWNPEEVSKSAFRQFAMLLQEKSDQGYPIQGINSPEFMEYEKQAIPPAADTPAEEEDDLPF